MIRMAVEIISVLLFLAFIAWIMYIIIKGIWSSFDNKESSEKYEKLLKEYNALDEVNKILKNENQNLVDRICQLENQLEKGFERKTTTRKRTSKKYE